MQGQTTVFVEDWLCFHTNLGEGAYGEVKLLMNKTTMEKLACKIIDHAKYKDASSNINREVTVHSSLNHENIIKFYGRRQEQLKEYLFLEYAAGGELFQMIEPDIGMASNLAQRYMKQLLNGLLYLHEKGIAHRDIKPENLLIDGEGTLKISDFGMATLFRYKGKERLMDKKCGTRPYLAPEVNLFPYHAAPADIWSCGIVFVAMLTGELPWGEATYENEEFMKWRNQDYLNDTPWKKLGNTALSLAKQILMVEPRKRLTIRQIQNHLWMKFRFSNDNPFDTVDSAGEKCTKRWNSMVEAETRINVDTPTVVVSQPALPTRPHSILQLVKEIKPVRKDSFSQPVQNDAMVIQFTQSPVTKENFHNLIKSMTRFYVKTTCEKTLEILCSALDNNHFNWNIDGAGAVIINTVDYMKNQLIFKVNLIEMDSKILLDFRLSKGCGLEFKKKFLKLKNCLKDIICDHKLTN